MGKVRKTAVYILSCMERLGINNCLLFAVLEAIKGGKYIVIRKSKHRHKCPIKLHFLVIPKDVVDEHAISYIPIEKSLGDYPCPLFRGYVKQGDK